MIMWTLSAAPKLKLASSGAHAAALARFRAAKRARARATTSVRSGAEAQSDDDEDDGYDINNNDRSKKNWKDAGDRGIGSGKKRNENWKDGRDRGIGSDRGSSRIVAGFPEWADEGRKSGSRLSDGVLAPEPADGALGALDAFVFGNGRQEQEDVGRLVSAMGLIMGTAVGPGILGLPAATLTAGLQASTVMIVGAWAYTTASILLVAELSCAVMAERGGGEVSFTGLVEHTLGFGGARVVALVYASLNYALLVACIAGLGSILRGWIALREGVLCVASAVVVVGLVGFAPFKVLDGVNRGLCGLMIAGITSLVGLGIYAGGFTGMETGVSSMMVSCSSALAAVPVTVLTLGFHVITPVICRVMGGRAGDARRAIFYGGAVPLAMVLAWNTVILGVAPSHGSDLNPIQLLLSLTEAAAPAVQAFAFAALATSLIGYAASFPKQLADTRALFGGRAHSGEREEVGEGGGKSALLLALGPPTLVAVLWPTAFASALEFACVYANCFLFGVMPPTMAWIYRYHQTSEDTRKVEPLVPGGKFTLLLLLSVSILLGLRSGQR